MTPHFARCLRWVKSGSRLGAVSSGGPGYSFTIWGATVLCTQVNQILNATKYPRLWPALTWSDACLFCVLGCSFRSSSIRNFYYCGSGYWLSREQISIRVYVWKRFSILPLHDAASGRFSATRLDQLFISPCFALKGLTSCLLSQEIAQILLIFAERVKYKNYLTTWVPWRWGSTAHAHDSALQIV